MACVVRWDAEDVGVWLEQCLQLPYRNAFREARIDGAKLIELNEEQLANLGVNENPHLLRLLSHIAVFRSQLGRTLLVAEEPGGLPEPAVSFSGHSPAWSPLLQNREAERRPRLSGRARSAPGIPIHMSSRSEAYRTGKLVKRGQQSGHKDSGRPIQVAHRRARSAEAGPKGPGAIQSSPQHALKLSRGELGATKKDVFATMGCMKDPSSVVAPYGINSVEYAGSSLAAASTAIGSETCVGAYPSGSRSNTDVDMGGDGKSDELTLAERARSIDHVSRHHSSSSLSAPRSTPRVRLHMSPNRYQDSIVSHSTVIYSEFGRDQRQGLTFPIADRNLTTPVVKLQGPEIHDSGVSALKKSGVSRMGQAERRTLECMFVRGKESPGVGKYSPPCRTNVRGGSMGSAVRWRSGAASKSPGPESYTPQHIFLSNFK